MGEHFLGDGGVADERDEPNEGSGVALYAEDASEGIFDLFQDVFGGVREAKQVLSPESFKGLEVVMEA